MPTQTVDPLPPELVQPAQARYATALRTVSANTAALLIDVDPADVLPATADVVSDLTVAHFDLLTGFDTTVTPDLEPIVARTIPASREVRKAALESLIGSLRTVTDELTYGTAAETAKAWDQATDAGIKYWARVVSPGIVCGLCAKAATRIYKRPDLQPIHDRCDCTIRPILPTERLTEFKKSTQTLYERVVAQEAVLERLHGRGPTGRGSRSRSSNVRVFADVEGPPRPQI